MRLLTDRFPWPEALRHFRLGALLAGLVLLLSACSGGPTLTDSGTSIPKGKTVPPVAISQIVGMPPGKISDLKTALAVAGGERDIGIVEGQFQTGSFSLAGQFQVFSEAAGVRVVYQWQLRDADGVLVQTIDGEDNAGVVAGNDPWNAVSPAVLQRIAKRTAESLAGKLSSMGYAARLSRLFEPPADYFAVAGKDAQREIDFETLNGPGMAGAGFGSIELPEDTALAASSVEPIPNESKAPAAPPAAEKVAAADAAGSDAGGQDKPKADAKTDAKTDGKTGAKTAIRSVAVIPVKGSPGTGNAELTAAMRKTLAAAGWPVVTSPGPDALTIAGRVQIDEKEGPNQLVSVNWEVQSPDGVKLGNVKQANNVPDGALEGGWGSAASTVAEAAASGIFDIVKRFR